MTVKAGPIRIAHLPPRAVFWITAIAALLLACIVYHPGLRGVFLFDDFANLPTLGAYGPVDNWPAFWRYITSGINDPVGRPLSLLSFLVDAHNWPADPYPFKRTSLVLHLLNGVLLALLLRRLGRALHGQSRRADFAAALGAALWLLHPLFVSTTLYVVQREAMLAATFALLGLLGWSRGRELAAQGRMTGIWLAAISIVACTALAMASKANGILLPLLTWLTDAMVLAPALPILDTHLRGRFAWMRRIVLVAPSLVLLAWLLEQGIGFALHGVGPMRPWTLGERLLTQARVVCDYLGLLWLPHPYTAGLFNDAFAVSTGWLSPPGTLPAIVFLVALFAGAVAIRKRAPALALAILFYFAGQLLESSVIPLELYYEHRNYLPALLMFWPLALWLTGAGVLPVLRRVLIVVLPLLLAGMTFLRADLWGNAPQQALLWAGKNPASPRAQAYAAAAERARGRPDLAAARIERLPIAGTEDIQLALNLVGAQCEMGGVQPAVLERARNALRTTRTAGSLYTGWIGEAIQAAATGKTCAGLGMPEIENLLDAMQKNPRLAQWPGWRQDNLNLRGRIALTQHDADTALKFFDRALDAKPDASTALAQAAQLGSAGYPAQGLAHLDHFASLPQPAPQWQWSMTGVHAWVLRRQGLDNAELAHLRCVLQDDLRAKSGSGGSSGS
ncbi:MAG TPA: tetratricopeptide repeat protein [Rudaea sp.]